MVRIVVMGIFAGNSGAELGINKRAADGAQG